MIVPEEVPKWIVNEDERLLVVDKPGDVVCHPSKAGPWSSLVGAAREYTGLPTMHLVFRLDRETMKTIFRLAKDGIVQTLIGFTSWIGLVKILAAFGNVPRAGYTIAMRVVICRIQPGKASGVRSWSIFFIAWMKTSWHSSCASP